MSKQPSRGSTSRKDEKSDKCANCSKSVGEKEMGIQCEICSGLFHSKCVDISAEVYSFMEKNKNVHWYCDSCNKGVACVTEEVSKLKLRQDLMDQSLKEMRSEIEELKIGLECGPMPNLMVALPNIGGALCSTPQSLADAHY